MRCRAAPPTQGYIEYPPPRPASVSFLSSPPTSPLLVATFSARSSTLVPRSLLIDRTETLATQAMKKGKGKLTSSPDCVAVVSNFLLPSVRSTGYAQELSENIKAKGARGRGNQKGFGLFLPTPVLQNVLPG